MDLMKILRTYHLLPAVLLRTVTLEVPTTVFSLAQLLPTALPDKPMLVHLLCLLLLLLLLQLPVLGRLLHGSGLPQC
jgi:hypothetical protein